MSRSLDFTYKKFSELLDKFLNTGYSFHRMEDSVHTLPMKSVILRHDVDASPSHSLYTAKLENLRNIKGTYYFRITGKSNDPEIIKEIVNLGHEIGYHYEDFALAKGDHKNALLSFQKNLDYFRSFYPVRTICMHGSPYSRWDNRDLWKYYSYRDHGIILEPYVDLDYTRILYLTDTGRKWNGEKSSIRDRIHQEKFKTLKEKLKTSDDILSFLSANEMPEKILITVHPQRWSDSLFGWILEYSMQTTKNRVKQLLVK